MTISFLSAFLIASSGVIGGGVKESLNARYMPTGRQLIHYMAIHFFLVLDSLFHDLSDVECTAVQEVQKSGSRGRPTSHMDCPTRRNPKPS